MFRKTIATLFVVAAVAAIATFSPNDIPGLACEPNDPACDPQNTEVLETGLACNVGDPACGPQNTEVLETELA